MGARDQYSRKHSSSLLYPESNSGEWELAAKSYSGTGRFDCSMHSNGEAVIHEYKWIAMSVINFDGCIIFGQPPLFLKSNLN